MTNEWIIDVLADLTAFATKNGMTGLERQLGAAALVAKQEMASAQSISPQAATRSLSHAGILHRATAGGPNA